MYEIVHLSNGTVTRSVPAHWAWILLPYGLISVVILAGLFFFEYRYPVTYVHFFLEDNLGENSSALALALGAILLILECRRPGHVLRRSVLIAVAAIALFIAAEEVSWGQRIFGFSTPEAVRAVNVQQELNLHNLKNVQDLPKYKPLGAALLIGLFASIVLGPLQRRSGHAPIARALPLLHPALAPLVLLTAWVLIFLPFVKSDEVGEWLFGFCLLAWATNLALDGRWVSHRWILAASLGALAGVMLLGTGLAIAFPPKDPGLHLNNTAIAFAKYGLYEQAEQVFEYILAHPQFVQSDTQSAYDAVQNRMIP